MNKLAKQLENLSAPSTGAIVDASQLRSQAAACESQMPGTPQQSGTRFAAHCRYHEQFSHRDHSVDAGLREDLHEQQAELDRVTRVRDLTKRHLGLKISKEKNGTNVADTVPVMSVLSVQMTCIVYAEAGLQILKFTFNNVAQSEPKQPFILKLAIEDSKFKRMLHLVAIVWCLLLASSLFEA